MVSLPPDTTIDQWLQEAFAADEPLLPAAADTVPVNQHDPDARLQRKGAEQAEFAYRGSFSAAPQSGLIVDATATPTEQPPTMVAHMDHSPSICSCWPNTTTGCGRRARPGPTAACIQVALTAIAIDLKKLVRFVTTPGPARAAMLRWLGRPPRLRQARRTTTASRLANHPNHLRHTPSQRPNPAF